MRGNRNGEHTTNSEAHLFTLATCSGSPEGVCVCFFFAVELEAFAAFGLVSFL